MYRKIRYICILILIFSLISAKYSIAWDDKVTHKDISKFAAEHSVLGKNKGDYLKNIGFDNSLDEMIIWNGVSHEVFEWLRVGAELEDAGSYWDAIMGRARYNNHFHDPTKLWNVAGLNDMQSGESSLVWAQDSVKQETSIGGDWSWQKTREHYYNALTKTTDTERQTYFAQTFRGLGQQMHLIQDVSQPAHVRNDAHPEDALLGKNYITGDYYFETWAKNNKPTINSFTSTPAFPQVVLNVNYYGNAPVTQFIDTLQYLSTLTPDTSLTWGLSEYTNSNFVSDDTIFTENLLSDAHYFPNPRYSAQCYELYDEDNVQNNKTTYLRKITDNGCGGESIEHFAVASPLFKYLSFDLSIQRLALKLDARVHFDYAQKLIPRAVGYSAGLLNYFFRGDIDAIPDEVTGHGGVIVNNTEETMDGTFALYYDKTNGERTQIWSDNFALGSVSSGNNKSRNITFPAPADAAKSCVYILVFRGQMGNEEDAVVGKVLE